MEISAVWAQLRIQQTSTEVLGIYLQKEDIHVTFQTLLYTLLIIYCIHKYIFTVN